MKISSARRGIVVAVAAATLSSGIVPLPSTLLPASRAHADDLPAGPTGVTAMAGDATATVSWTAPQLDGSATVTSYTVDASPMATPVTVDGDVTSAAVSGLTNGSAYTFTVTAHESVGDSAASDPSSSVYPVAVPAAPTNVTAVPGNGSASVSWTAPASAYDRRISGYDVVAAPGGTTVHVPGTQTSSTVAGLTNGSAYTFTVRASNATGVGSVSDASAEIVPFDVPGAPRDVTAAAADSSATVSWTAPASDYDRHVTGYTITAAPGGATKRVAATITSAVLDGLTNGTSYTMTVTADNASGTGPGAVSGSAVPAAAPDAPTSAHASATSGQATIVWDVPVSDHGAPITSYTVTSVDGLHSTTVDGTQRSATLDGLVNGTAYSFVVTATNAAGTSSPSDPTDPVTPVGVPAAPTSASATALDGAAQISWTAGSDGGSPITGYTVTADPSGQTVTVHDTTSATMHGLTNGIAYAFTVTAANVQGTGPSSTASAAVTPFGVPPAPGTITTLPNDGGITVQWSPAAGNGAPVSGYTVTAQPGNQTVTTDGATSATLTGLTNGTSYSITVTATNTAGTGPASNAVTAVPNPPPPTAITLTADQLAFPAGGHTHLTAGADNDLGRSHSTLTIRDRDSGAVVATCTTGTLCSADVSWTSGGPRTYLATAGSVTSNAVTISRQAWTLNLVIDKTTFAAGDHVTLTATANQDVALTSGIYNLWIRDDTTGSIIGRCTSGTNCIGTSSFTSGGPHTYTALVSDVGGAWWSWQPGGDLQATAADHPTAQRAAWTVSLSEDKAVFNAGDHVTLTATANQDVALTGGVYNLWIRDDTTGSIIGRCTSGTSCVATSSFTSGNPHSYTALVSDVGGYYWSPQPGGDVQGTAADHPTAQRAAWSVSLSEDKAVFNAGDHVTLTATANQDVGLTGGVYNLWIRDDTTGSIIGRCTSGTNCIATSSFASGGPHSYTALVSDVGGAWWSWQPGSDVQVTAAEHPTARRAPWTVSLSQDQAIFAAGDHVTLTASANQDVGLTGGVYNLWIRDDTTGSIIGRCTSGTSCVATSSFTSGGPHTYSALVSDVGGAWWSWQPGSDVQATAAEHPTAQRAAWTVALAQDKAVFAAGDHVTLTATSNQDVGLTGGVYNLWIRDDTTGSIIGRCTSGTSCVGTSSFNTGGPHTYTALVSDVGGAWWSWQPGGDVQATAPSHPLAGRKTWTVRLQQDKDVFAAGDHVTLTAIANQDVGLTGGSYNLWIRDNTTSAVIARCTSGSTCVGTSTFSTGGPHNYTALVADIGGAWWSWQPGGDVQATSARATAARQPWTVDLSIDKHTFAVGDHVTLTATANQDLSYTAGAFVLTIMDATTGYPFAICGDGKTCTGTTSFYSGGAHSYVAYISNQGGPWYSRTIGNDVEATSTLQWASRSPWTVSLTQSVTDGTRTLHAHANQDVGQTLGSYSLTIRDMNTGNQYGRCDTGTDCETTVDAAVDGNYRAFVGADGWTAAGPPDLQADSTGYQQDLARPAFTVAVDADRDNVSTGDRVNVTATANRDLGDSPTPASLYVYDIANGILLSRCDSGDQCAATETYTGGPPPNLVAFIAASSTVPTQVADLRGVLAASSALQITTSEPYVYSRGIFAPSVELSVHKWHFVRDQDASGIVDLDVSAHVSDLGNGFPCLDGCSVEIEGGMPEDDGYVHANATPLASVDVFAGQPVADVALSGTQSLPDQLYVRVALRGPGGSILAASAWTVASSLDVQTSDDVAQLAPALGLVTGTREVALRADVAAFCLKAFPVGTPTDTSLNAQQIECLQRQAELPNASFARLIAKIAVHSAWLSLVTGIVEDAFGYSGDPSPDSRAPKALPDEDPAFLSDVARLMSRTKVVYGTRYEELTEEELENAARQTVRQCTDLAAKKGFDESSCETMPVFAPGWDVREAAAHDNAAIMSGRPAILKYRSRIPGDWYKRAAYQVTPDGPNPCFGPNATLINVRACDEYPFGASDQGGPNARVFPSLEVIDYDQNKREGDQYKGFLDGCGLNLTDPGTKDYLIVPIETNPKAQAGIPSVAWC